ncbi:LysR family transcriptional regulator [Pseudomonas aeruginosa]|uniref:LysR family transcriptional regulator n=1 Tax=Pseudomonas aeruginosa TaxID=287 RepID=UPI0018C5E660|nr:LysR family transcriptional regulator [Pseudomonas aeruginosa]EKV8015552.1 LysR family transcriptional regulator [Pseudomonas aeruginosa]EKX2802092.1 LysR family transcriptional regulator [Pseudomonas aeruginosa]MBG5798880.1 LysR family transcriptional regulator [Pseudomonas aeruginosa]MBP8319997.1 LysR family transcriptional regulator [Pseudomonas aeruginosa]MBP8351733.1 LysR family transcriptional regulator [Pseudomonas aeruginosa]
MSLDERVLRQIDLNILVTFLVIFRERGVSRAAHALNITQPAVSNSLGRLRKHFNDPLFVRRGGYVEATGKAIALAAILEPALVRVQVAISSGTTENSATDSCLAGLDD